MNCPYCSSAHIKRSRLRLSDFPEPLIGRLPMRCGHCSDRFFVWLPEVFISNWKEHSNSRIIAEMYKSPRA
jgi:DNA-directed RNA polymerase subunit RPC12/RpoP